MAIRQRRRRFLSSDSYYYSPPPPSFESDYHSSSPPLPSPSPQPSPYDSPPPPPPPLKSSFSIPHKSSKNITLIVVLFLCALAIAFLFLSYLTIRKQRNSRTRRIRINSRNSRRRRTTASTNEETENPANLDLDLLDDDLSPVDHPIWYIRTVGLQQSVIDSITIFKYKRGESLIEGADCSVCLSEFEEDETLRLLPKCSHAFHIHCIDTWLSSHQNCPLCRAPIVSSTVSVSDSPNSTVITINDQVQLDHDAAAAAVNPDPENPMNSHSQRVDHVFPDEIDLRLAVDQFSVEVEDEEDQDRVSGVTYHKDLTQGRNSAGGGGGTRVLSDLGDHRRSVLKEEDEEEGSEVMGRRSVSMDALSAAYLTASFLTMAKAGGEGCSSNQEPAASSSSLKNNNKKKTKSNSLMDGNHQDGHTSRVTKTYSFGRFLQRGSSGHDTELKRSTSSASAASSSGGFFSLSSKH